MLMAATLARGRTDILNAAREPHVQDLARALQAMGARIEGAGTDEIIVDGVDQLGGVEHSVVADYLEAGTYAIAVAAVGGDVVLENAPSDQLPAVLMKLDEAGAMIEVSGTELRVSRPSEVPLRSVDLTTWVHPGFPTDLQAQYLALMSQADGRSVISEFIFENRFQHVPDLIRMGARIVVHGRTVTVFGPCRLEGTDVRAGDIRSGAALVIAALCATGTTTLREAWHVDRGYEDMPGKLLSLGAMIERGAQPQASARAATGTYE
jgi:UDP-N-acetylglucosamine 1-carboxyvinyltransferase